MISMSSVSYFLSFWAFVYLIDYGLSSHPCTRHKYQEFRERTGITIHLMQARFFTQKLNPFFERICEVNWFPWSMWFYIGTAFSAVFMLLSIVVLFFLAYNTISRKPIEQQVITPVVVLNLFMLTPALDARSQFAFEPIRLLFNDPPGLCRSSWSRPCHGSPSRASSDSWFRFLSPWNLPRRLCRYLRYRFEQSFTNAPVKNLFSWRLAQWCYCNFEHRVLLWPPLDSQSRLRRQSGCWYYQSTASKISLLIYVCK